MLRLGFLLPTAPALAALLFLAPGSSGNLLAPAPLARATTTSLSVVPCIEVEKGERFSVNILVNDVSNLLAWEVYFAYNRQIVEIVDKDVRQLLNSAPNSNVFDFSDPVPNSTGLYRIAAADTGGPGTAETGSGVLATLTLVANDEGLSWSSVYRGDVDHDGTVDIGPTLTETGGQHIADTNGDGIFDGPIVSGQIAVGRPCAEPAPTPAIDATIAFTPGPNPGRTTPTPAGGESSAETPAASGGAEASPEVSGGPGASQSSPERSPVHVTVPTQPDSGSGGGGLSSWLIGLAVGSASAGLAVSYIIYRTVRRPA